MLSCVNSKKRKMSITVKAEISFQLSLEEWTKHRWAGRKKGRIQRVEEARKKACAECPTIPLA